MLGEVAFQFKGWALGIFIAYIVAMLGVGYYASRRIKDSADYIVAGRRLPLLLAVGTILATWVCGGVMMGSAEEAYGYGLQAFVFDPLGAGAFLILAGIFLVRVMRRGRFMTSADLPLKRFGRHIGALSCIAVMLNEVFWVGATITAFGAILSTFTGLPLITAILISTIITAIYTLLGGMWAVTLTDFIQMILLILAVVIAFPVVMKAVGGWSEFVATAKSLYNPHPLSILPTKDFGFYGYSGVLAWAYFFIAFFTWIGGNVPLQDFWQRTLSAKNEKTAVRAAIIAGVIYFGFILVSLMGIAAFKLNPNLSEDQVQGVMPMLIITYMHPALAIIASLGIIGAIMSSADSGILAAASLMGKTFQEIVNPKSTPKNHLRLTRILVPVMVLIVLLIALVFKEVFRVSVFAAVITLVSVFPMFVAALYFKKANNWGAAAGIYGGFGSWILFTVWFSKGLELPFWDASEFAALPAIVINIVALIIVSLATQKKCPAKPLSDIDGKPLSAKGWFGLAKSREAEAE
jgi:SSS family solute:Na+ symporter